VNGKYSSSEIVCPAFHIKKLSAHKALRSRIPYSGHLFPFFNHKILDVALLRLWF